MPNTLDVTTNSRMTWTLTGDPAIGTLSENAELRTGRTIANGIGQGQANVAWRNRVTIASGQTYSLELDNLGGNAFGFNGKIVLSALKDFILINRAIQPGLYVLVGAIGPSDTTGYSAKVNSGGDYRVSDYIDGWAVTSGNNVVYIANPGAQPVQIDIGIVGVGTFADT